MQRCTMWFSREHTLTRDILSHSADQLAGTCDFQASLEVDFARKGDRRRVEIELAVELLALHDSLKVQLPLQPLACPFDGAQWF